MIPLPRSPPFLGLLGLFIEEDEVGVCDRWSREGTCDGAQGGMMGSAGVLCEGVENKVGPLQPL